MIVATWNVNGLRARWPRLKEWLAERRPDVACLQELKLTEGHFPSEELRAAGYEAVCAYQQSWNGVAIIAKQKPELRSSELAGADAAGARFIQARVGGIDVVSVYVPNGKTVAHPDFSLKISWLDRLATYLETRADKDAPMIVAGDINVCPRDIDSFGGEAFRGTIFHTEPERALYDRIIAAGFVDLFRQKHADDPGFSFWDYRAGAFHKRQGMRIDVLFGTKAVAERVRDVVVDREFRKKSKESGAVPSDHAPVYAELA